MDEINSILICLFLLFTHSCSKDVFIPKPKTDNKKYLHLSHTRTDVNPEVDSTVKKMNLKKYHMLLLGGDLAENSSINQESLESLDSTFNLKNIRTLWAIGNHDDTDIGLIESYTGRSSYNTYQKNNICFVVLNTELNQTSIINDQLDFFNRVTDTLSNSSHLIIIHHKLLWMYNHPELEPIANDVSNGNIGNCGFCLHPNNFYDNIYPKLLEVNNKGIEVICIGGDIGKKTNQFEFTTKEGIHFLASGIDANKDENQALLLEHDMKNDLLFWEFVLLDTLE